jgi:hypothetical protein
MTSLQEKPNGEIGTNGEARTRFSFTLCNSTPEEIAAIDSRKEKFKYIIVGLETAPTTGMQHLQGYFEVTSRIRISTAKKLISEKIHIEIANGSREENQGDCSKESNILILYEVPRRMSAAQQKYAKLIQATKINNRMEVAVQA